MTTIIQNKYEKLFDEFLDLVEFELVKYDNEWGVIDNQGANLGDIEDDRFTSAANVLDHMDIYINDYFIEDIEECLAELGYDMYTGDYKGLIDYCKDKLPDNKWDLDVLDMICNHADEINLNHCVYRIEKKKIINETEFKYIENPMDYVDEILNIHDNMICVVCSLDWFEQTEDKNTVNGWKTPYNLLTGCHLYINPYEVNGKTMYEALALYATDESYMECFDDYDHCIAWLIGSEDK